MRNKIRISKFIFFHLQSGIFDILQLPLLCALIKYCMFLEPNQLEILENPSKIK